MWEIMLWIAAAIVPTFVAIYVMVRLAELWYGKRLESSLRAVESITTGWGVPYDWERRRRQRISRLLNDNPSEARQVAVQAQERCLRRLDGLIRLVEAGAFSPSPETREQIVTALRHERQRWAGGEWFRLMGLDSMQRERTEQNGQAT